MDNEQIKLIKETIENSIEKTVNGKIRILTEEFREHKTTVNQYIIDDTDWKQKAQPVIQMGENVQGFGRVSLYVVGFIASVTGAVIMIINIFRDK